MDTQAPTESAIPATKPKERTFADRIWKASLGVFIAHICLKLAGVLQYQVLPNYYGGVVSDVFIVVYTSVITQIFLFGEQCIGPAFLPVFSSAREKEGEPRAWAYTSVLFTVQLVLLLIITAALILFPDAVIDLFTQWDDGKDTGRRALALKLLPWMAPALIGMSLASLTYMVLNGYKEFFFAAFGDSVLKVAVVGGALVGLAFGKDVRFIAIGAVAGGTLKLLTHLYAIGGTRLKQYRPSFNLNDEYVRNFFALTIPLLLGITVSVYRDAVMQNVLTAQDLVPTYFRQGKTVIDSISFLVPYTLSIALLPYFCDLSAREDMQQLGAVLTKTIRMLIWFFVPVACVLAVAAFPVCFVLFSGKVIKHEQIQFPALVMQSFAIQLPFAAIEMMLMQAFFSNRRMIAPTVTGIVFSFASAGAAYYMVVINQISDAWTILLIVSLALAVAKILKSVVLVSLLKASVPLLPFGPTARFAWQVIVAGGAAVLAAMSASWLYHGPLAGIAAKLPQRVNYLAECILIGLACAAVYLVLSILFQMDEPRECWHWAREKLRRRKAGAV